jgi:hypothetical protein
MSVSQTRLRAAGPATCVEVLRAAGFRLIYRDDGRAVLRRGARSVVIALDDAPLGAERFEALLAAAGMTAASFDALLEVSNEVTSDLPPSTRRPESLAAIQGRRASA